MTMLASDIITRAGAVLNDTAYVRWTNAEMFLWITDGAREACNINPKLYTKRVVLTLAAGAVQPISISDFNKLLDVPRNMLVDGVTPGQVIYEIDSKLQDALDPLWQTATQSGTINHYMYDLDDRYVMKVQPPATSGTKVEIIYSAVPAAVSSLTDVVPLPDATLPALTAYAIYRAQSKDAEFADVPEMAAAHYKLFTETVSKV